MRVRDLIAHLQLLPPNAEVRLESVDENGVVGQSADIFVPDSLSVGFRGGCVKLRGRFDEPSTVKLTPAQTALLREVKDRPGMLVALTYKPGRALRLHGLVKAAQTDGNPNYAAFYVTGLGKNRLSVTSRPGFTL